MKKIYVKPADGRATPMPEKGNALLPDAGDHVPYNAYWRRRLDDKDVVEVEPPAAVEPAPPAVVAATETKGGKAK